jgi:uncharacterized protein (TIGR03000 family)
MCITFLCLSTYLIVENNMRYLALALFSVALLVPSQLNAQGRGRGGNWNGGGSRWNGGGSNWSGGSRWIGGSRWNGGWSGSQRFSGYGNSFYGNGIYGNRYYGNSYYNSGFGYGNRSILNLGLGNFTYSNNPGYYSYSSPRTSYYYETTPSTVTDYSTRPMSSATANQARVEIRLLNASDEVRVQGQLMPGMGVLRSYTSPELTPGKEYVYTISVRSDNNDSKNQADQRTVDVRGGSNVMLDFTLPAVRQLPNPTSGTFR